MAESVSAWLARSRVALDLEYALELVRDYAEDIKEVEFEDDGETYVLYEGLDDLFISEGLYCNIGNDVNCTIRGRSHYVYLMLIYNARGIYTGVAKVGVSGFVDVRCKTLNEAWKKLGWKFRVESVSRGMWSKKRMYNLESSIHSVLRFKGLQYEARRKYDGFSELFTLNEKDLEVVKWMLKK